MERTQDFIFTKDIQETEEEYTDIKSKKEELYAKIREASREVREGKGIPIDEIFAELEEGFRKNGYII